MSDLHVIADCRSGIIGVADDHELLDSWLGRLGPSATLLAQRFARDLDALPAVDYDHDELAAWLGIAPAVLARTLDRLARFGFVAFVSCDTVTARLEVDPPRPRRAAA